MQPKLKGDTFYMPVPNGVYLRNNQNSLTIRGQAAYRWLESLTPFLNGRFTLAEITQKLEPAKQAMVTDLIKLLLAHHFLKDVSHDLPHTLLPVELEIYAPEIAFIDSFCDSAAHRFEYFRERELLVIGSGLTLTALAQAALKSGVRQLTVLPTDERVGEAHDYRDQLDLRNPRDARQTIRTLTSPQWDDRAAMLALLQPFDCVLYASDRSTLSKVRMLNQLCVTAQKVFLPAVFVESHAWVGPLLRPDIPGCWECAWLRLQANLDNTQEQYSRYAFQDHHASAISPFFSMTTAAIVTHQIIFELLKYASEAGPLETANSLIEMNLETLQSQQHAFLPHPLCSACQPPATRTEATFQETLRQLEEGEPLDPDLFFKRAASCFEKRLGLFSTLDEADFEQVPLHMCKARVSHPLPQETTSEPLEVIGAGAGFPLARQYATLRACEIYAASIVNRQLLLSEQAQQTPVSIEAKRFITDLHLTSVQEWAWAIDLHTTQICLVPAPFVYPVLRSLSPLGSAGQGISSGMSWAEAISQALLKLGGQLTIAHLADVQAPYPQVDLDAISLESQRKIQRHIYRQKDIVKIYDVTGPLQVPTFACCRGEQTISYSSHFDTVQALQNALKQVAQDRQARRAQQLSYALPPVPDLPLALRGDVRCVPHYDLPESWPKRQEWVLSKLLEGGWHAFAVPLDHDPALNRILPYIVHVLLAYDEPTN